MFQYPTVRRDKTIDEYFGVEVADPYRWLEDPDSQDTKQFVDEQNAVTSSYINNYPHKEQILNNITKLWNFPKQYAPFQEGSNYFQYRNTGLQNQNVLYKLNSLDDEAAVFLDPNLLSNDGTISLSGAKFSENGGVFAYGLSYAGSDWIEIRFKNVETGEDYDEVLRKVKFSTMSWLHDNIGFIYAAYTGHEGKADGSEIETSRYQKLYYHKLGTPQSEDVTIVEFDDPELRIGGLVSYCGNYLIVTAANRSKSNLVYLSKLEWNITGKLDLKPVVSEFKHDYQYITNNDDKFFFRTNDDAQNYKIVIIDFTRPERNLWKVLVPEHESNVLVSCKAINTNQLVLCYLNDVKHMLSLAGLETGAKIVDFPFKLGTVKEVTGKRYHKTVFYSFGSYLTPNVIYKADFSNDTVDESIFYQTTVEDFDASNYTSKQVFYSGKDGTKIPMFLVHKNDFAMDGTSPVLLYGYGGFNVTLTPSFSILSLAFINHFNGCFAVANIRGGGEYGERWHNGGRLENKQNCFDDFQFAAKHLFAEKYTNPKKLSIMGGSNGGLLVAACINQSPELYASAICQVGVLDLLRFHKFTIGHSWKSDYGSSESKEGFDVLRKYSPLHNIKQKPGVEYPATLLLTADHDDRVVPLHSFKFIAELQCAIGGLEQQKNPLLIRVETKAGHGGGKPTSKLIEELTDILSFIGKSADLEFRD